MLKRTVEQDKPQYGQWVNKQQETDTWICWKALHWYHCGLIWLVASAGIWLLKAQSDRDWGEKGGSVKQVSGTAQTQRANGGTGLC